MMRNILLTLLLISEFAALSAQSFVQVSNGTGYAQQAYFRLSDDAVTPVANESWDLAFSTIGLTDAGISVNESTTSVFGQPVPELELYLTSAADFSEMIDTATLGDRLFNDESSWENGAVNGVAAPDDPFDLGWGAYNPVNHSLSGSRIFAIKLRDGSFRKFIIESLSGGAYTLRYADLDGSDEQTVQIAKNDFPDAPLALFSFETGETLPSTGGWDLFFGRYYTKLDDGEGNLLDYPVTGVLSAPGVEVAEAVDVDPATVEYEAYVDSFDTRLDIIGYDWKSFDFAGGWILAGDVAYFVKTPDGHIWKLHFIDFEGSSTGVSTFEKTDLGLLSSVASPHSNFAEASLFPNPVVNEATVAFTLKRGQNELPIQVQNLNGQMLWSATLDAAEGFNVMNLPALNLPAGMYVVSLGQGKDAVHLKMVRK